MATRSTIAVKLSDNSYQQVYCHWDGYLSNNGQKLLNFYNSQSLAELVTSHGGISSLHEHFSTELPHTFDNHAKDVTILYKRDTSELGLGLDVNTKIFKDLEYFENNRQVEEFNYLFENGQWYVQFDDTGYLLLTQELINKHKID